MTARISTCFGKPAKSMATVTYYKISNLGHFQNNRRGVSPFTPPHPASLRSCLYSPLPLPHTVPCIHSSPIPNKTPVFRARPWASNDPTPVTKLKPFAMYFVLVIPSFILHDLSLERVVLTIFDQGYFVDSSILLH